MTSSKDHLVTSKLLFWQERFYKKNIILTSRQKSSVTRCWNKKAKFSKSCLKSSHSSFYLKMAYFKIAQRVTKYSGYFCMKICCGELSKSPNLFTLVTTSQLEQIYFKVFSSFVNRSKSAIFLMPYWSRCILYYQVGKN